MSFDSTSYPAASSSSANSTKKRGRLNTSESASPPNVTTSKKFAKKSPFADFGSYMVEKNRKLREQFDADASASSSGGAGSGNEGIFQGVSIFVDGFTVPSSLELKGFMLKHGGRFENYFSRHRVTHIICSNLPDSKMKNFRAFSRGLPVVKPAWILESVVANKLLNWVPYQLRELVNESGKQRKLSSFFACKSISSSTNADSVEDPRAKFDAECHDAAMQLFAPVEDNFSNFKKQDDESVCFKHEIAWEEEIAEAKFTDMGDEYSVVEASDSSHCRISDKVNIVDNRNFSTTIFLDSSNQSHSTLADPNFVGNYFKNSRLHFIGTWRNRYRKHFCNKPTGVQHINVNVNSTSKPQKASIIHIDMVADQFYSILHKHCNKVQAVSCDEAFLDATESANNEPENLALMIRKEVAEITRCTASAGIAENMLLARLATRSAKPNGQCFISPEKVDSYLEDLPIKVLPGIGHALEEKLKNRQIHTCGQLRLIPKETLHKDFGAKTGDMLWNYCRGVDNRVVEVLQETKSVGAEVNWGVRFNDIIDIDNFLLNLCKEVSFRLQECGMEGRTITLKVKKRRKGAGEPAKFMGCGDCESMSRSITIPLATEDTGLLQRTAKQLFASFHIDVKDVRGVGLQISRLETAGLSRRGREKNALETWLASYGKTGEKGREPTSAPNLGDEGAALFLEEKHEHQIQQDDANCQPCSVNENLSYGPSHIKLSSAGSDDNRISMLPELCNLDIEAITNLPPDIFSELNDMYNGKLCEFMNKYNDEESKTNAEFMETPFEAKEIAWSSGYQKIGSNVDGNIPVGQPPCLKPSPDTRDKGKHPLCSPNLAECSLPSQNEGAESALGNAPMGSGRTRTMEKSTINLWLGKPPIWVEVFQMSNSLLLKVVADIYAKFGRSCNLSSVLQSLFSCYSPNLDLISEGRDEVITNLCELIMQYIDLKIESDIEEIYICFRLLKRFASTSMVLLEVYSIVLPLLQVSVNEQYGGQLQLS